MHTWLFRIFTVLWILDTVFTTIFIGKYGVDMEANRFLRFMIHNYGIWTLWAFKALSYGAWYGAKHMYKVNKGRPFPWYVDGIFVLIMIPVCYMGAVVAFV